MKPNEQSLIQFYASIWSSRKHVSEVSGKFLGYEPNLCFFAHCIPKRRYPEYKFLPENIILMTQEEHAKYDSYLRIERLIEEDSRWKKILDKAEELKARYEEEFGSKLRRK